MPRVTSALLLGGVVVLVSYINAPAAPGPALVPVAEAEWAEIGAVAPLAADLAQETERLRARLAAAPEPPAPRRDPFRFGEAPRPARTVQPDPPIDVAPLSVEREAVIAWPTLVAVLADRDSAATLIAALAIGDSVEILKVGEVVGGFVVREITPTSVTLVHVATSTATHLALR